LGEGVLIRRFYGERAVNLFFYPHPFGKGAKRGGGLQGVPGGPPGERTGGVGSPVLKEKWREEIYYKKPQGGG